MKAGREDGNGGRCVENDVGRGRKGRMKERIVIMVDGGSFGGSGSREVERGGHDGQFWGGERLGNRTVTIVVGVLDEKQ